jgi:hypothetical protein
MKILPSVRPFEEYKVYGPYLTAGMDRYTVRLKWKGITHSMSYARYLMCVAEGRRLGENEHVDHIDNDRKNDRLDNLQILTPSENIRKSPRPRGMRHGTLSCYRFCKCTLCTSVKSAYMRKYYQTHARKR